MAEAPERAAVIAALEGEHQALAVLGVAHELEAVLDRLAAADIEVDAALQAELLLGRLGQDGGQLDLLAVQVLARHLRQPVELAPRRVVETRVAVAEIDGRIPHLQVEVLAPLRVVEERALAAVEDLGRIGVVHGVAVRAVAASSSSSSASDSSPARSSTLAARSSGHVTGLCMSLLFPQSSALAAGSPMSADWRCFEPAGELHGRLVEIRKRQMG